MRRSVIVAIGLALAAPLTPAWAVDEADLKAAIVFNLLGFIEWPQRVTPAPGAALRLCVAAKSGLRRPLQQLNGTPVRDWRLEVRDAPSDRCHALVLGDGAPEAGWRNEPVAVFSEAPHSDADAVTVHLDLERGKVRFELDVGSAQRAGLQLSSKLMRLARKVYE
jgi:hypothetical protein